jgi:hypothetical protein
MRLLAYNTTYNALTGSLLSAETALSTAKTRNSAVIQAKALNYLPKSITAPRAEVFVRLEPQNQALSGTMILDKGSLFQAIDAERRSVRFVTTKAYSAEQLADDSYEFPNVELVQGNYDSFDFIVNERDKSQRLVLPNENIDASLLEVYVQEGASISTLTKYQRAENVLHLTGEDRVFFLQENRDGRLEIEFGDNVFGKAVGHGKLVRALYLTTNGASSNGISNFMFDRTPTDNDLNTGLVTVTTLTQATGGSDRESKESIQFRAPKNIFVQNRAHTSDDYVNIVSAKFPELKSIAVWGGQNDPAPAGKYGKVLVAVHADDELVLTDAKKEEIRATLQNDHASVISRVEVVTSELIYLLVNTSIRVDETKSLFDANHPHKENHQVYS